MKTDVILFGSGRLARAIVYSLATTQAPGTSVRVSIVGRNRDDVEEIAAVARGRAGAAGERHAFEAIAANWPDAAVAGDILERHQPQVTIVAASEQSPWELTGPPTAWTQLVKQAGYAVTLPFSASLVSQVFRIANTMNPRPFFINANYADAVNAVLAASGSGPSDRLVGLGNVAILESLYRGVSRETSPVRIVAHHRHLGELSSGDERDPPLIYANGARASLTAAAGALRAIRGPELNWITGASVCRLIAALIADRPFSGSVPGPRGEIGGYPVKVENGAVAIDLPDDVSMPDARDLNTRAAIREGVVVQDGTARFSPSARDRLMEHRYAFAEGFAATQLPDAVSELRALRERLRQAPPIRT